MLQILYTETVDRIVLMTGLVLSIAVLATGTILPSVEAMKPTVDSDTGIKIQCKVPKGGNNAGQLVCTISTRDGIDFYEFTTPISGPHDIEKDCEKRQKQIISTGDGDYTFTVTKCGVGEATFFVNKFEGTVTVSLTPP